MTGPTQYLFLSHSWRDKNFVRKLDQSLLLHGVSTFLDERDIDVGDSIPKSISDALERSTHLVYVISETSIASRWVEEELSMAQVRTKESKGYKILPVLLESVDLPLSVRHLKYADFRNWQTLDSYYSSLGQLLQAIGYRPLISTSPEWINVISGRTYILRAAQSCSLAAHVMFAALDIGYSTHGTSGRVDSIVHSIMSGWDYVARNNYRTNIAVLREWLEGIEKHQPFERLANLHVLCKRALDLFAEGEKNFDTTFSEDSLTQFYYQTVRPFADLNVDLETNLRQLEAELLELGVSGLTSESSRRSELRG